MSVRRTLLTAFSVFLITSTFVGAISLGTAGAETDPVSPDGILYAGSGSSTKAVHLSNSTANNAVSGPDTVSAIVKQPDGARYVYYNNGELIKYDSSGTQLWSVAPLGLGVDAAAAPNGDIIISGWEDTDGNILARVSPDGTILNEATGNTNRGRGLAVDDNGNIYQSDNSQGVAQYDSSLTQQWRVTFAGHQQGLEMGPNGYLYSQGFDNARKMSTTDGSVLWTTAVGTSRYDVVEWSPDGTIAVVDSNNGWVRKLARDDGSIVWEQSVDAHSVHVDTNGEVYVGTGTGDILKYASDGSSSTTVASVSSTFVGVLEAPVGGASSGGSGGTISGVVKDQNGGVLTNAILDLQQSGSTVLTTTTNSTGHYSFGETADGNYTIRTSADGYLNDTTDVEVNGTDVTQDIVLTENTDPVLVSSSPNGSYEQDRTSVQLNATVEDPQGENVTVAFYLANESGTYEHVGTNKTVASGATASVTASSDRPGTNHWYVIMEDETGAAAASDAISFRTPNKIYVRHDVNLTLLDSVSITGTISSQESSYQTPVATADGVIDMNGAPDEDLKIELNASGYAPRSLLTTDPSKRIDTTLLEGTGGDGSGNRGGGVTYQQCFELDDQSGVFDPSVSYVIAQDLINGSYADSAGNYFGAGNYACLYMVDGRDYRLVVENDVGDRKEAGGFTGDQTRGTATITIQGYGIDIPDGESYATQAYAEWTNQTAEEGRIVFEFDAGDTKTTDLEVSIYERGNESNTIFSTTQSSVSTFATSVPVTGNATELVYVVEWSATVDGNEVSGSYIVSLAGMILDLGLSSELRLILSALLIIFVGGLFGQISAPIGGLVSALMSGFLWLIGWSTVPESVIIWALTVSATIYIAARFGG